MWPCCNVDGCFSTDLKFRNDHIIWRWAHVANVASRRGDNPEISGAPWEGELSQDANLNLGLGHIWVTFGQHLGYIWGHLCLFLRWTQMTSKIYFIRVLYQVESMLSFLLKRWATFPSPNSLSQKYQYSSSLLSCYLKPQTPRTKTPQEQW